MGCGSAAARTDLDTIADLRVPGRNGLVPLSSVADIALENGPIQIDRYDRSRYVNVSADLNGTPLGAALDQAMASPAIKGLPEAVRMIRIAMPSSPANSCSDSKSPWSPGSYAYSACWYCCSTTSCSR